MIGLFRWRRVLVALLIIEALTYGHAALMILAVGFFALWLLLAIIEHRLWIRLTGRPMP